MLERLAAALADRYTLERELGQGGMATVYLAHDLKHDRKVALKVLKPELAAVIGAERFVVEIKTTAALQHPHILPLFDSGTADGFLWYAMPFIDGETLRAKLDRETQLRVDEAVRITSEVADALDYAHRHGVVHRDIKPENILLTDGRPLVADFGIALALSAAAGGRMTETGMSLGTPHYMSPEQATADKEITGRSDIYSLASVLFEMLTGNPPHTGSSAQQIIMKILAEEAQPVAALRKSVPSNVADALAMALQKLPADRFATAHEFAQALSNPAYTSALPGARRTGAGAQRVEGRPRALWLVAAVAVLALGIAGGFAVGRRDTVQPRLEQQRIRLGNGTENWAEAIAFQAAVHPAGLGILFPDTATVSGRVMTIMKWKVPADPDGSVVVGLEGASTPTFSPDGEWIAFVQGGDLKKRQLAGGSPITLARGVTGGTAFALAWLDDGSIVFEDGAFLLVRIAADGSGAPDTVSTEQRTGQPIHMTGIPGTQSLLVSACVNSCSAGTMLSMLDLDADTAVRLADDVVRAWPGPDGRILYLTRSGLVLSARLDLKTRALGPAQPVMEGVRVSADANGEMQVGRDGTALLIRGRAGYGLLSPGQVSRSGRMAARMQLAPHAFTGMAVSPDGRRVALTTFDEGTERLWVTDIDGGPLVPLTPIGTVANRPVWIDGGRRVAYVSLDGRRHIRAISSDGASGTVDTLLAIGVNGDPGHAPYEVQVSPTGDTLVIRDQGNASGARIVIAPRGGEPSVLLDGESNNFGIALSPDGAWLAYASDISGRSEVYVRPFPGVTTAQVAISLDGGAEPQWAHDGEELFYRDGAGWLVAAQLRGGSDLRVIGRERLFDASGFGRVGGWRGYQVMPGDEHFLMLVPAAGGSREVGELILVKGLFAGVANARD